MRKRLAVFCLALSIPMLLLQGVSQGNPTTSKNVRDFLLGGRRVEVTAESGRLLFQAKDADGNPAGEPWFWPEEDSPLVYESPQIVENGGETWLTFVERSPDGGARSRTVSLSEIFANGFEAGTTAAWTSTEPAVNLFIESPAQDAAVGDDTPSIRVLFGTPTGIAIAPGTLAFTRGGSPLAVSCSPIAGGAECVPATPFADGAVTISSTVADVASHVSPVATRSFQVDTADPVVTLSAPREDFLTGDTTILVAGAVSEAATVRIGATPVTLGPGNSFSLVVPLVEGANLLVATATDAAGNVGAASRNGVSDTLAPPPVAAALVTNVRSGSTVAITGAPGAAEGEATVRWRNQRTAQVVEVAAAPNGSFSTSIGGEEGDVLVAVAIDALDHESLPAYFPVDYEVPADPAPFAPPLDPTVAYDLGDAIAFLYDGPNAVQKDVVPGAIEERRLAWLRGTVRQRGGAPLPGARVTILGHPELGYTLSRADGVFDLVANGGGVVTLSIERAGFLPVQRQEEMAWRDSTVIDDVILLGLDPVATEIEAGSLAGQIVRSTPQEDFRGEREAILFFPPGTNASLVMPGGANEPLSTLTVRATEYTVGEEGFQSMPGPLPANVAYTYAVELSADEALAAGAEHVVFNQPVFLYVDSFIPFPVGHAVPSAWYDLERAVWVPSDDGRVIEILAATGGGLAEIDVDGNGAADAPTLEAMGFTDAERSRLAQLYSPGHRIWRAPIEHFSPYDMNFPFSPPEDAEGPPEPVVKTNDDEPEGDQHDDDGSDEDESSEEPVVAGSEPTCTGGSIIECENQIVRQQFEITGTPYRLSYSSQRTPGWGADQVSTYQVRGATVPASLKRIVLQVKGSGVNETTWFNRWDFENRPFLSQWVRLPEYDAFGRTVHGQRKFRVHLGYAYRMVYRSSIPEIARSWARLPGVNWVVTEMPDTGEGGFLFLRSVDTTYDQIFRTTFGTWDGRSQKLGGFTLDVHHAYDPVGRTLHRGDGSHRSADVIAPTLRRIAGNGATGFSGDGFPATLAELAGPGDMVFGPDGTLYFADGGNYRIRAVRPDGTIETVAGSGLRCTNGSGGGSLTGEEPPPTCDRDVPATSARLNGPSGLDIGPDGSLYFTDYVQSCVYRVDPAGTLRVVAGICHPAASGPGSRPAPVEAPNRVGPATEIELENPGALAVTSTGILYLADYAGLSQVTPDGILARVAAPAGPIFGLAAGANGELYLLDDFYRIFRMAVDGSLELIAGGGASSVLDGEPAAGAFLGNLSNLTFGRDGRLYFLEEGIRVRRIEDDGTLKTVAGPKPNPEGTLDSGAPQEGGFLLGNQFARTGGLAVDVAGNLLIADNFANQIFQGEIAFPDYIEDELKIAEGGQVYVFDDRGRHLRTLHALTGAVVYEFEYDGAGLLVSVEDGNGNVTTIERAGSGQATAIVSPFGQRTELAMDSQGWLASLENPNEETHHFLYRLGQMVEAEDPRGHKKIYEYSDLGRLTAAYDEAEKKRDFSLIGRFGWPDNTVTLHGAREQKIQYTVRKSPDGSVYRSTRNPDGMLSINRKTRDGATELQDRGILSDSRTRPDPRLGEGSAYTARSWVFMSEELELETNTSIDTLLADPADPWSFEDIATVTETNGRLTSSLYSAATRTMTTVSPEGRAVSLQLDELARPISFEAPETETWTASYLETGELEEIVVGSGLAERKTSFGYDAFHRLQTIEDAEHRIVTFAYDGANRVTSTLLPDLNTVGFSYDGNGNVESVTPPGKPAHVFTYTERNQLETYVLPDAGSGTAVEERVYDDSKRLKEVHRPDGKLVTFEYKPQSDRLTRIVSPRGNTDFEYDSTTGFVSEIEEPDGQKLSFEYEGLLLKRTTWTGEVNGSVGRTYDENFRVKTIDVNGQDPIEYVYDDDNLLIQVGEMTITRDPESGRELTTQLGNVTTERTYTPFGEPESYTAKFSGTEIYYEHYTYNKLGWITDLERRQNGFNEDLHYEYDDRGRLIEVWRGGVLESSYAYDANSNRLSYTGPLGNASGTYDERDRMLTYGGATYIWSEAGELQSKTEGGFTTTYDYDVFGNLRKVELPNGIEIEYLTDGAQRRIGKKVNGVLVKQWLYQDGLKPNAEIDLSSASEFDFIYGSRVNVPEFAAQQGQRFRFLLDFLGSVRLIIDATSGEVKREVRYDETGRLLFDSNPGFLTFGFAGGSWDVQTGLNRFGLRDLHVESGRWTAPDALGFGAVTNFYEYANGNPVSLTDPLGLEVSLCSRPADLPVIGFLGIPHKWIKTSAKEAGLGQGGGGIPGEGEYISANNLPFYTPTSIVDHTGQASKPNATCVPQPNVDEKCVNEKLQLGEPQGTWKPVFNDCWTFVENVLADCRTSVPSNYTPIFLPPPVFR